MDLSLLFILVEEAFADNQGLPRFNGDRGPEKAASEMRNSSVGKAFFPIFVSWFISLNFSPSSIPKKGMFQTFK